MRPDPGPRPAPLRLTEVLWLAACAATIAAAAHVAWYFTRVVLLDTITGASRELPWLAPISYLGTFLLLALPGLLLGLWLPRLWSPLVQGTFFAALSTFAILLHVPVIHPGALFLLSLGAGVQAGRWLAQDPGRRQRGIRMAALCLGTALFLAGVPGVIVYRLRPAVSRASAPLPVPGAPNVLLLILDTVRAANLSLYGYHRATTPTLEQLGAAGVVFESAIAPSPWTAPSHASMLTGRYPFFAGISYRRPLADSLRTVAEVFASSGYATAAFTGNALYAGRTTGLQRGFDRFTDYPVSAWQLVWSNTLLQMQVSLALIDVLRSREWWRLRTVGRRAEFRINKVNQSDRFDASQLVDRFLAWRDESGSGPFFAMINFFDAHAPYESPLADRFDGGTATLDRYDGAITYVDSMIGHLVEGLRERGTLENTVLLVTSDHGEHFGEHGLQGHGNSLYLELLHVPLLVMAPGERPVRSRIQGTVSLRDLPATMLDLARLRDPAIRGVSLAPLWRDSAPAAVSPAIAEAFQPPNQINDWPTSFGPLKAVVGDQWHYIRRGDGLEQVWARERDTLGRGTLTSTPDGIRMMAESRATLARKLGSGWTGRAPSASPELP